MSTNIKALAVVGILATLAACEMSQQEEFIVGEPEPISVEPTYTGKFN